MENQDFTLQLSVHPSLREKLQTYLIESSPSLLWNINIRGCLNCPLQPGGPHLHPGDGLIVEEERESVGVCHVKVTDNSDITADTYTGRLSVRGLSLRRS